MVLDILDTILLDSYLESLSKAPSTTSEIGLASHAASPAESTALPRRPRKRLRTMPPISFNLSITPPVSGANTKVTSREGLSDTTGLGRRHVRSRLQRSARANTYKTTGTMAFTAASTSTSTSGENTFNVEATNISKPGWQGLHPDKDVRLDLKCKWEDENERRAMVKDCRPIHYHHPYTASIYDNKNRLIIYCSRVLVRSHLPMSRINGAARDFVAATVSPCTHKDMEQNSRGEHWFSILGLDRNNSELSKLIPPLNTPIFQVPSQQYALDG
ncbi:hypothetical protein K435DRAFT_808818 [Dendrothele bispora CBS 962.96]|uniref:Uncharacterized protein n=1 Tax=Dendrothele bispora (strain CBS 962.96) TaxID=1314807 RepID=A0A4S8L080_DENBC|nr:hypothetical protein K435DRAFT_808818 [Dendrothele bispora CBS 962.96]